MQFRKHLTVAPDTVPNDVQAQPLTPAQVAKAYNFPPEGKNISKQVVAILELGGGDLLGLSAPPNVKRYGVDGGQDNPIPSDADGEVCLDEWVISGVVPNAQKAVIYAPNSDQGFVDGVAYAESKLPVKPVSLSISWGAPESQWTDTARAALDAAFQKCLDNKVAIPYAAAGDNGSSDGLSDGANHVDYPASSPYVLACGGTRLTLNADGTRAAEKVWSLADGNGSTGGGVSNCYPGRTVPDMAGNADPVTGYKVKVDLMQEAIGGTSAVAPLFAALHALIQSHFDEPIGSLKPFIDALPDSAFFDVVEGSNGAFSATPGKDNCTGRGVPDGMALLAAVQASGLT